MNKMSREEELWFLSNAGTGADGEMKDLSYNGINARLINKGGIWRISSWQRVANPMRMAERSVINSMRKQYGLN